MSLVVISFAFKGFNLHLASGSTDTRNFPVSIITCIDVRIRCKSRVWCFDICTFEPQSRNLDVSV